MLVYTGLSQSGFTILNHRFEPYTQVIQRKITKVHNVVLQCYSLAAPEKMQIKCEGENEEGREIGNCNGEEAAF